MKIKLGILDSCPDKIIKSGSTIVTANPIRKLIIRIIVIFLLLNTL